MARAERLLAPLLARAADGPIQALQRQRRPVSAERLAAELLVSVRSVYRDAQTLRAQGAGIEGEAGLGYVLAEKLPRSRMALLGEWREREGVGAQLTD